MNYIIEGAYVNENKETVGIMKTTITYNLCVMKNNTHIDSHCLCKQQHL